MTSYHPATKRQAQPDVPTFRRHAGRARLDEGTLAVRCFARKSTVEPTLSPHVYSAETL
jgi:hypothetical protein